MGYEHVIEGQTAPLIDSLLDGDSHRAAVTFQTPDRVPVIAQVFGHAATLANTPLETYIRNGKVLANCQLQALEYYGYDAVFALMAVHVEAEAVGLVLDYRPGQYPFVSSRVLAEGVAAPYLYRRKYQAFTFSGGEFGFGGKGGGGAGEAFFKARRVYPFCFSEENEWSGVWKEVFTAVGSRGRNGNESVRFITETVEETLETGQARYS